MRSHRAGVIAATDTEPLHFLDDTDIQGLGQFAIDFIGWGADFADFDNDGWSTSHTNPRRLEVAFLAGCVRWKAGRVTSTPLPALPPVGD